jgi:hypothetical protein
MLIDAKLEVTLIRGVDEPPLKGPDYQLELRQFYEALRPSGFYPTADILDPATACNRETAECIYDGKCFLKLDAASSPILVEALQAWFQGKCGRKVKIQTVWDAQGYFSEALLAYAGIDEFAVTWDDLGDLERSYEAETMDEVEALLARARDIQSDPPTSIVATVGDPCHFANYVAPKFARSLANRATR